MTTAQSQREKEQWRSVTEQLIDDMSIALNSASIGGSAKKTSSLASNGMDGEDENEQCSTVLEGVFTSIYCVHDPENKMGSRTGYVAIKSLNEMYSDDDHVSRLQNEHTLSQHLAPQCNSIRASFVQTDFDGRPALFLEWVPGITLSKWIHLLHNKQRPLSSTGSGIFNEHDLKVTLQLAFIISKALAEIHDAGVIHNNLTADNIIVGNIDDGENVFVKVIGLGSASFLTENSQTPSKIRSDIISLGSILFQMFTDICPFREETTCDSSFSLTEIERKIMLPRNHLISTLMAKVPLELAKLTLNLMEVERTTSWCKSAKATDIVSEIDKLLSNLNFILIDYNPHGGLGQLQIHTGKLYGRDFHLSVLMDACNTIGTPGASKMVLISGFSGVGKSAIVEHVKAELKQKKVQFISGKFDQHKQAGPLSAMDAAVAEYTNNVIHQGPQSILNTKRAILDAIETDIGVLTGVFPCLCEIIGKPTTAPTDVGSMAAQNRFKFIFQMFIRAITTPSCPIILFLDDLQWADQLSFQLISTLITDAEINDFLFIGSYRDNEIDTAHSLTAQMNDLKNKNVSVTNISIGSISKEDVNAMISDIISMPQHMISSLSDIVYKKTSGNALFVTQFLWSIWDEGLLSFSLENNTWQWDSDTIEAKEILDDVGVLLSQKILQLPAECQHAVKLLACIGAKCDVSILKMFMGKVGGLQRNTNAQCRKKNAASNTWLLMLEFAVDEGLLKKEGSNYAFAHDQIQHAAYSLIPEDEQGRLHKRIGELILGHMTDDNCDVLLFIVVDQLNRGQQNIKGEDKRLELVMLNLKAGEKSISLATFSSSALYLKAGIDLLCGNHWERFYDLSLRLYSSYVEVEHCNGHFQEVGQAAEIVIRQAKSFEDKYRVYATMIKSLAAQNKLEDAVDLCFNVLTKVGVQCPSPSPDKTEVVKVIIKMKETLENMTVEEFLRYPVMYDSKMLAAMKFLFILRSLVFFAKQQYFPIVITEMMQLTFRHGLCKESCTGLSGLSYMLCAFEDFKASDHIGRLALLVVEKFNAGEYISQTHASYYSVRCYHMHIKLSLEKLLHGYTVGMQYGDIECAFFNACLFLFHSFISGRNLVELKRELTVFGNQMIEYKQILLSHMALSICQLVSNLVSSTVNPLSSVGQDKKQTDLLAQTKKEENALLASFIILFGGVEAYLFGKYELAAEMVQRRQQVERKMSGKPIFFGFTDFYDGLIFLAMAHKTNDTKWILGSNEAMSKVESFMQTCTVNCEHKLLLLQAETSSFLGEKDIAFNKYELAIAAAERNNFIHEQAVANERAGDFLLRNGDARASEYYGKAHGLYVQWGAQGKADHLGKNIPF